MAEAPLIVIAHESETIREAIRRRWRRPATGARGRRRAGRSGARAGDRRRWCSTWRCPRCMRTRSSKRPSGARRRHGVVLVASIYNRTGYKRRPTSLYGADDYVEQHHIPDRCWRSWSGSWGAAPQVGRSAAGAHATTEGERIRDAGERRLTLVARPSGRRPAPRAAAGERAAEPRTVIGQRRRARAAAGLADRRPTSRSTTATRSTPPSITVTTDELEARLRIDLEEGRLLFDLRVPEEVRRTRDFISEALERDSPEAARGRVGS